MQSDIRDGDLVVFGQVRHSGLPGPVAATIRVSIMNSDGNIIAEQFVTYPPSLSRHRAHHEARFFAQFDGTPERGATIRIMGAKAAAKN